MWLRFGFVLNVGLSVGLALILPSALSAGGDVCRVSVQSVGPSFNVKVEEPTTVRAVLNVLCEYAKANCELPPHAAEFPVEPGEFHGTWTDVVGQLLDGWGTSYAATPPVSGRAPFLLLEPSAPARAADRAPAPGGGLALAAATGTSTEIVSTAQLSSEPVAEPDSAVQPAPVEPPADSPERLDPGQAGPSHSSAGLAASSASAPGFAMTPFSDTNGNPFVVRTDNSRATPGMAVLPVSDSSGNPMVLPLANGPLTLTPFAGPDGQPWPAPPPQPGQKLQYPIPPSPSTPEAK